MTTPLPTIDEVKTLIQKRPADITLKQISQKTKLPEGWLSMFHQGKATNPSYDRIKTLYEYLKSLDTPV